MKKIIYLITALLCVTGIANAKFTCQANFTVQVNGLSATFTDASGSTNTITSWQWDFGDGSTSTSQNPVHSYAVGDTFQVCLTIHDNHGCSDTWCHPVIVTTVHLCHASFTFGVDSTGTVVHFTNTSTGTTGTTTYSWDFGDGGTSALENPTYTYPHPGHHVVCLFISDATTGCSSHFCHVVFHGHVHHHHGAFSTARVSGEEEAAIFIYPNPVQSIATAEYTLNHPSLVKIELYDLLGNKVYDNGQWNESEGQHSHEIDVSTVGRGIYFLRLTANEESIIKKITVWNN